MVTARRILALAVLAVALPGLAATAQAASPPVWLCRPGLAHNPCAVSLKTAEFTPAGQPAGASFTPARPAKPKIDCFYVYPTVSNEPKTVSDRKVQPENVSIALYQAARYTSVCRMFAPMYRQLTLQTINTPGAATAADAALGYGDVLAAWNSYLEHDNKGRGVVLMGHSQGSFVLRQLIAKEIDKKPAERKLLVSAQLLGGNVVVKKGGNGEGGDFANIPICRSDTQLGCVLGFSTFNEPVPADSLFGRVAGAGITAAPTKPGTQVLCTNPAALSGGSGSLDSIFPTAPFAAGLLSAGISLLGNKVPQTSAPWVEAKDGYTAHCENTGTSNVLQVVAKNGAPVLTPSPTPEWGLHLADANLGLGNLIAVMKAEADAWAAKH